MAFFFAGLLLCLFAQAFDPSLPPDALSLYPCDQKKFDAVINSYTALQTCYQRALQDSAWCESLRGVKSGTLCLCVLCADTFAFALSNYETMIRAGECPVQIYNVTFGNIPSTLMQYPCLFKQLLLPPITSAPSTSTPTSQAPTLSPTPSTSTPSTSTPSTSTPSTSTPSTSTPSTSTPSTSTPSTSTPTTNARANFLTLSNFSSTYCPDPSHWMCGAPSTASALLPRAGSNTRNMCIAAMQGGCSPTALWRNYDQYGNISPWCKKNSNGVVFTNATGVPLYSSMFVTVLDIACDPTSLYATKIVSDSPGFLSQNYTVQIYTTNDKLETSESLQLLPNFTNQGYDSPPTRIMYSTQGMYDVITCLPGTYCQSNWVRQCWKGSFCPSPTQSVRCPEGYFCPQASTEPIKCGFLETCSNYTRTQMWPVAVAVGILILGIIIHSIARIWECCAMEREKPQGHWVALRSPSPAASTQLTIEFTNLSVEVDNVRGGDEKERSGISSNSSRRSNSVIFNNNNSNSNNSNGGDGGGKKAKNKKTILHAVSGQFQPGLLTAVMGASGSSKSTLMDAILGNIQTTTESSILVNGQAGNLSAFRGMVGFVGQQDILHRSLTVREAILHSAYLRLPSSLSHSEIRAEVETVLEELDLLGCANTLIGDGERRGVSGGQRKRTSIGVELVANPRVLFMDEPTTGLSSTQSLSLTRSMKRLARGGRTVVAVIHQPRHEMFVEFDSIFLLAKGHVCFYGPQSLVVPFFHQLGYNAVSPEELMDVLSDKSSSSNIAASTTAGASISHTPSEFAQQFVLWQRKLSENKNNPNHFLLSEQKSVYLVVEAKKESCCSSRLPSGFWRQFWTHFTMEYKLRFRNPATTLTSAFIYLFAGALLGVGFLQSDGIFLPPVPYEIGRLCPAAVRSLCTTEPIDWTSLRLSSFFLSLALGQSALVSAVWTFGRDMDVQFRQAGVGVSQSAYFTAKVVADIPFIIAGSALFAAVFVPMLRPDVDWYQMWLLFALLCWAAYGLGYLLSLILPRSSAVVVGVVIIFAFSICSGLAPKLRLVHENFSVLRIFWDISFPRYLVEAFVILEARLFLRPEPYAFSQSTRMFFAEYGFKEDNVPFDMLMVLLIGLVFRGLALLSLRRWHRPKSGS